ncbi:MAG: YgiQ family radical SAM protein [Pirellulales bacterium]|nr:YgiQ family radical SAM protein [Pirellulales bacterium]
MTPQEVAARGWDVVDVVFVTGDAYVDHPSFAMALLGRVLESEGFRVAILSQPDWHSAEPWKMFGRPRICFAVSAGNMDSMLNHYTANRKVRNDDAYSPGGAIGRRPDRATLAYCQRAREAYKGVPILAGGVEASLRRLAHYDYWSDKVRRSILMDAKPDLLVYGMGERPLVEIVKRLAAGEKIEQIRDVRGTAFRLGAKEVESGEGRGESVKGEGGRRKGEEDCKLVIANCKLQIEQSNLLDERDQQTTTYYQRISPPSAFRLPPSACELSPLPSFEQVSADKAAFAEMTRIIFRETNPYNARGLVQFCGKEAVVVNPPAWPMTEEEIDRVYGLPFVRKPHPSYGKQKIPAFGMIKDSVQILRGCFGGCTFCSITAHEGRIIQSRSEKSVLAEIERMTIDPAFKGTVSDIGGPTANMYRMNCTRPEMRMKCRRLSCVHPAICPMLGTDHGPLIQLMQAARKQPGVKKICVASGIRMDLALRSAKYIAEVAKHHTGGLLKVAPEHADPTVLKLMKKPPVERFEAFCSQFQKASAAAGKEQYIVPYFIAGHPGSDLHAMIDLALYLKRHNLKPDKVQDFIPGPLDIATCMYYTGLDPMTGKPVYVPKGDKERRLQRAMLQYYKPENYADVRAALEQTHREELIGPGPECLIPSKPPKGARTSASASSRKKTAEKRPKNSTGGYRPHRKSAKRRK